MRCWDCGDQRLHDLGAIIEVIEFSSMLCLYNFLEKRGGLEYLNTYKGEKGKRSKEAKRDDRPPTVL